MILGLEKINGSQNLQGTFEAFKFSETSLVRFQVNVQFCVGDCKPSVCGDGIVSLGRKKRETPEDVQDVLDMDTDLVKEIFVESGSSVERLTSRDLIQEQYPAGTVFIRGQVTSSDSDIVCTSWPVVLAASAGIVFLQLCIIATCITCLYTSHKRRYQHHTKTAPFYLSPSPPHQYQCPLYNRR